MDAILVVSTAPSYTCDCTWASERILRSAQHCDVAECSPLHLRAVRHQAVACAADHLRSKRGERAPVIDPGLPRAAVRIAECQILSVQDGFCVAACAASAHAADQDRRLPLLIKIVRGDAKQRMQLLSNSLVRARPAVDWRCHPPWMLLRERVPPEHHTAG